MKIPILDLTRQYRAIQPEIDAAIRRVLESGRFILGPEVEEFEREIAEYLQVLHAIGVASGTDALLLALKALGIGPGHGVIVPSFTFFATAGAVVNVGATPIFADIDPKTYNISVESVAGILRGELPHASRFASVTVKAIIPVHLYGQPADMEDILALAEEFELDVIEDAAQAIGAESQERKAGTIGHLGCLSFFPTKNLGAYGDGGMVVTNDDELAERVRMLRVHGSKPKYYHHMVGTNSRLDALQAAILRAKLPHLGEWTAARQRLADHYDELLGDIEGVVLPHRTPDRSHIFHQYTIRVLNGKRDALHGYLGEQGIATEVYYPLPWHLQPCFRHLGYTEGDLPESEPAGRRFLSRCSLSSPKRSRIAWLGLYPLFSRAMGNVEEGLRWLDRAEADMKTANDRRKDGSCCASAFSAHQAAEKALKGFLYSRGYRAPITPSVLELLRESARLAGRFGEFLDHGKELDRRYIASRYPNFYPSGAPY